MYIYSCSASQTSQTLETIDLIEGFSAKVFNVFWNNAPYRSYTILYRYYKVYSISYIYSLINLIMKHEIIMTYAVELKPHCTVNILIMHISLGGTRWLHTQWRCHMSLALSLSPAPNSDKFGRVWIILASLSLMKFDWFANGGCQHR